MKFVFIKHFNPAYDVLALRYFQQGGIDVDQTLSHEEARKIRKVLLQKAYRSRVEEQFCEYVGLWEKRPEDRPTQILVLKGIFGVDAETELGQLVFLESKLKKGEGKLLFSKEDVAAEISDFYTKFLGPLLAKDLAAGKSELLSKYVEPFDEERLPDLRTTPRPEIDRAVRKMVEELAAFLQTITPTEILAHVDFVLEAHYGIPYHLKRPSYYHGKKDIRTCEHITQDIGLQGYTNDPDHRIDVTLFPQRGAMVLEDPQYVSLSPWYDVRGPRRKRMKM